MKILWDFVLGITVSILSDISHRDVYNILNPMGRSNWFECCEKRKW
jgi:hypothetical protein